jgi:hypothetical protein
MAEKQNRKPAPHRSGSKSGEEKLDASVDMTFPASDAPAPGRTTGTEPPARPTDRKAPIITKEQIEAAANNGQAAEARGPQTRKRARG